MKHICICYSCDVSHPIFTNFVDSYKFGVNQIFDLPDFSFSLLARFKYKFEFQAKVVGIPIENV